MAVPRGDTAPGRREHQDGRAETLRLDHRVQALAAGDVAGAEIAHVGHRSTPRDAALGERRANDGFRHVLAAGQCLGFPGHMGENQRGIGCGRDVEHPETARNGHRKHGQQCVASPGHQPARRERVGRGVNRREQHTRLEVLGHRGVQRFRDQCIPLSQVGEVRTAVGTVAKMRVSLRRDAMRIHERDATKLQAVHGVRDSMDGGSAGRRSACRARVRRVMIAPSEVSSIAAITLHENPPRTCSIRGSL
jgi:hypothetical protein